jgi:hypothetical protein
MHQHQHAAASNYPHQGSDRCLVRRHLCFLLDAQGRNISYMIRHPRVIVVHEWPGAPPPPNRCYRVLTRRGWSPRFAMAATYGRPGVSTGVRPAWMIRQWTVGALRRGGYRPRKAACCDGQDKVCMRG